MIEVAINLSRATPDEIERFYALAGVGRALDAIAIEGRNAGVRLVLLTPSTDTSDQNADRLDPIH